MIKQLTHTNTSSDEMLLKSFQKDNDLEVLGVLFNKYMHLIYGVCLKYLKNSTESQDAVMQIFEVLVVEVPKHEIRNFKSWVYGVTRNFCLMKLRKEASVHKNFQLFKGDFMESSTEIHPLDEETPDISNRLAYCFDKLKALQKQCVQQFYYEEQCYRQIAIALQLEEKKVKSYIQNGKRNLKICLEKKKTNFNG